jgi:peptide deformylase
LLRPEHLDWQTSTEAFIQGLKDECPYLKLRGDSALRLRVNRPFEEADFEGGLYREASEVAIRALEHYRGLTGLGSAIHTRQLNGDIQVASGLAAPLAYLPVAVVLMGREFGRGKLLTMCRPKIVEFSEEQDGYPESCMSDPAGMYFTVRPTACRIEYLTPDGAPAEVELKGIEARRAQHEVDHGSGIGCWNRGMGLPVAGGISEILRNSVYVPADLREMIGQLRVSHLAARAGLEVAAA